MVLALEAAFMHAATENNGTTVFATRVGTGSAIRQAAGGNETPRGGRQTSTTRSAWEALVSI